MTVSTSVLGLLSSTQYFPEFGNLTYSDVGNDVDEMQDSLDVAKLAVCSKMAAVSRCDHGNGAINLSRDSSRCR